MNPSRIAAVIWVAVLSPLAGCGGGSSNTNSNNLTQAQAQQVGSALSDDVSKALANALGNTAVPLDISSKDHMVVALHRQSQAGTVAMPEEVVCNGTSCTVSGTYTCPDGGSVAVSGNFSGSTTSAGGTLTETPSNCSDGTLVLNGNPDVTVGVQGNDNGVTTTVNVTIGGGVKFSPVQAGQFPTGSCSCNLSASASVNDTNGSVTACSISGSICGHTINANCSTMP